LLIDIINDFKADGRGLESRYQTSARVESGEAESERRMNPQIAHLWSAAAWRRFGPPGALGVIVNTPFRLN
jgi:hypothetical protein